MSKRMFKRGLLGGAVMAAAVAAVPDTSDAGLVYDLRITGGSAPTSGTNTVDGRTITGTGTVIMQLWARVSGTDGDTTNEGLQTNYIVLQSSEVSGDAFSGGITTGVRTNPFNAPGTRNGGSQDLNADGVNDWGSVASGATDTFYMFARSLGPTMGQTLGSAVDADTWQFQVASFTLTASALNLLAGGDTRISVVQPSFTTDASSNYVIFWDDATMTEDGFPEEGTQTVVDSSNSAGIYGDFVTISVAAIPEPASLSILGLAGAGLLSRRRRIS